MENESTELKIVLKDEKGKEVEIDNTTLNKLKEDSNNKKIHLKKISETYYVKQVKLLG